MLVATPSGITLAPEGGAHQSIATPLIGMGQPGLASFEPGFVDELAVIMQWGFEHMQHADKSGSADEAGGSVYLRLSTRMLDQVPRVMTQELAQAITNGAYWLREPGPNCEVVIAYTGAVAPEAVEAAGLLSEDRRDVGLLAITSADRLFSQWSRSRTLRTESHVAQLLGYVPPHCAIVTVNDGHPAALAWLGGVKGHRITTLGVETFGQSASLEDIFASFGLNTNGIIRAVEQVTEGKSVRHRKIISSI